MIQIDRIYIIKIKRVWVAPPQTQYQHLQYSDNIHCQ